MAISGLATVEGTSGYLDRFPGARDSSNFRRFRKLRLSSLGFGTYLGGATPQDDALYETALRQCLLHGCNVVDTAINYRHMASERTIGKVLNLLVEDGLILRSEIFVSTKGGMVPYDAKSGEQPESYMRKNFVAAGLISPDEMGLGHSISSKFIKSQFERSLANLGLEAIDLYYIHNPEIQLSRLPRISFLRQLKDTFSYLESECSQGRLGCYGLATWDAFRVEQDDNRHISIPEILKLAEEVGGKDHHLGAIQMPLNLTKTEGVSLKSQPGQKGEVPAVTLAAQAKLPVFTSSALDGGQLAIYIPDKVKACFPNLTKPSHFAIQFSRSCPGVVSTLVGMRKPGNIRDNLELLNISPAPAENFIRLFEPQDWSQVLV